MTKGEAAIRACLAEYRSELCEIVLAAIDSERLRVVYDESDDVRRFAARLIKAIEVIKAQE